MWKLTTVYTWSHHHRGTPIQAQSKCTEPHDIWTDWNEWLKVQAASVSKVMDSTVTSRQKQSQSTIISKTDQWSNVSCLSRIWKNLCVGSFFVDVTGGMLCEEQLSPKAQNQRAGHFWHCTVALLLCYVTWTISFGHFRLFCTFLNLMSLKNTYCWNVTYKKPAFLCCSVLQPDCENILKI